MSKRATIIWRVIESGLIIAIVSVIYYVGAKASQIERNTKEIAEIKTEHKSISAELKVTRETMLKDVGEIKGDIKVLMQRIH